MGWGLLLCMGGSAVAADACDSADARFICGLHNAEDLVRLPGTPWVVASQMNMDVTPRDPPLLKFHPGAVQAVRIDEREPHILFPTQDTAVDWDRKLYPECPQPPPDLTAHGMNVRSSGPGRFRLYVVNHGGRESIEVVDLIDRGATLSATWRGCLLVSKAKLGIFPNSVVPLPDDGLMVSGGGVATWRPAEGWKRFADIKGSNGIERSADGRFIYVADSEARTMTRIAPGPPREEITIKMEFLPDNLRWGEDGFLYVAGPFPWPGYTLVKALECVTRPICDAPFSVARIDPRTFTAREIYRSGDKGIGGVFGNATVALPVGNTLWLGTVRGDRIAILPGKN